MKNKINTFKNQLKTSKKFLLDGGMGSEIEHLGFPTTLPLWSAEILLTQPEIVQQIHEDYIKAGAEIIVTDTFRTTRRAFAKKNNAKKAYQTTLLACKLAHQAVQRVNPNFEVYVAGSIAPLEDCYSPELTPRQDEIEAEHHEILAQLKEAAVDFILFETMITLRETLSGIQAAKQLGIPFAVSFCCNEKMTLLSGEPLEDVLPQIAPFKPLFIGTNCITTAVATQTVKKIHKLTKLPVSVYAQGDGAVDEKEGWKFGQADMREQYVRAAKEWLDNGAQIIGGCCGTTPEYIKDLRVYLKSQSC